jgi:hypothetical protein
MDVWGFVSADNHYQGAPTWSPNGNRIAWTGGHCECLSRVDVSTGRLLDELVGDFSDPSWDRAGIVVSVDQPIT